ncbi:hypothetical protein ABBQ38_013496 [Trebouxia sp. C0009 RCD-2024]
MLPSSPDPPRRVSQRLGSRDRVTWSVGGVRQVASSPSPTPAQGEAPEQPAQRDTRAGPPASSAQGASQPQPVLNSHQPPGRKRSRPVRPTGVQQMTDTESDREEGTTAAGSVPLMARNKRQASRPGSHQQATERSAEPASDEDHSMAAQHTGRSGQPSSHQAEEASTSALPDSHTARAAGQRQRGKRQLRTAGGKVIGREQPTATAGHGTAAHAGSRGARQGRNAAARAQPTATAAHETAAHTGSTGVRQGRNALHRGRSSFSFDRTLEDEDVEASQSDPDAPTRRAT